MAEEIKNVVTYSGLGRFKAKNDTLYGKVKSVQGISPDSNGNVDIPEATTSAKGLLSTTDKTTISNLKSVATSGAYADLTGTPTDLGDFTNTKGYALKTDNVASATKATQDSAGNVITDTYVKTVNGIAPEEGNIELTGGINLLKRETAYEVGEIAYYENLPSWAYLECITAGTTAAADLDVTPVYTIKVTQPENGTITVNGETGTTFMYSEGTQVTIDVIPDDGYEASSITVDDTSEEGLQVGTTFTDGTVVWVVKSSKEASSINPTTTLLYENAGSEVVNSATLSSSYYAFKGLMIIVEDVENNCTFNTVAWTWQIDMQMESNPDAATVISMIGALDTVVMVDPMTIETSAYNIKKVYGLS